MSIGVIKSRGNKMKRAELAEILGREEHAHAIDRLVRERIAQAFVMAFPVESQAATLSGRTVEQYIREVLNETWDKADAS